MYRSSTCWRCCASGVGSAVVASAIVAVVVVVGAAVVVGTTVVVVAVTGSAIVVVVVVSGRVGTVPSSPDEVQPASDNTTHATPAAVRHSRIGASLGKVGYPEQRAPFSVHVAF